MSFKQIRKENLKFLISDAVILLLLPILTAYLRFEEQELNLYTTYLESWIVVLAAISLVIFVLCGTYRRLWLYAGLRDFTVIIKAVTISTAISFFLLLAMNVQIPESFFLTEILLGCILFSATRLTLQFEKMVRKENLKFFILDAVIVAAVPFVTITVSTLVIFYLFGIYGRAWNEENWSAFLSIVAAVTISVASAFFMLRTCVHSRKVI